MAQCQQLDFLQDLPEFRDHEISLIKIRVDNVQRGIFKRHDILSKELIQVKEELEKVKCSVYFLTCILRDKFGEELQFNGTFFG